MQGAKIDPKKDPEQAALRDQYRGEFLQAMVNAGESRKLAARTFSDPGNRRQSVAGAGAENLYGTEREL